MKRTDNIKQNVETIRGTHFFCHENKRSRFLVGVSTKKHF